MFFPHCHHIGLFGNNQGLLTGLLLGSALAVEHELQDSRRRQIEQSEDNRHNATQRESGTTAPLKRNR